MSINFATALGIHPMALQLREQRTEILGANLANADTPNYKARDLDFQSVLQNAEAANGLPLRTTDPGHLGEPAAGGSGNLLYRVPAQASLDGNTVDTQQEQMRFGANALQYQASLRFLGDGFAGLRSALRGD
jgi:flagellar basal-body rod protein FlgB